MSTPTLETIARETAEQIHPQVGLGRDADRRDFIEQIILAALRSVQPAKTEPHPDTVRLDWLLDRAGVMGGGNGADYTITFRTPIDTECDREAIDAAAARRAGG